jgi:transcriptional regulator with XRE-family HTH domain
MPTTVTLSDRLRLLRAARNVTQIELARRAGLEPVTLTRIEGGKREPRPATLDFLAQGLEVSRRALDDDLECFTELARICGLTLPLMPARKTTSRADQPVTHGELAQMLRSLGVSAGVADGVDDGVNPGFNAGAVDKHLERPREKRSPPPGKTPAGGGEPQGRK